MKNNLNTKLEVHTTKKFDKQLRMVAKQGKNIEKLITIVEQIANKEELDPIYKNHKLINNKNYKDCYECHIEPDWLLVYKYIDNELILLLFATGTHSNLFR